MTNERDIWERQASDTDKSYQAFCVYRGMGRDRSVRDVAHELGKSSTIIGRWSSKHGWVARASAYDNYLDSLQRSALEQRRVDAQVTLIDGIMSRCNQMLDGWDNAYKTAQLLTTKRTVTRKDGTQVEIAELSLSDQHGFTKWLADIDSLYRRQLELPDRYTQQKIETETPRDESWERAIANIADRDSDEW